jgi:heat shock protein HtpX
MQRIFLFLITNIAVVAVIGIITSLLGLGGRGGGAASVMGYALMVGFSGSIVSLLLSKFMAKTTMGVHIIESPANAQETWLVDTVRDLATKAKLGMPEVGIYSGEPNAFATGAFRNSALVAVSTGLLTEMSSQEVEAVLAHEVSHIANGDMVTMTLIQGVMNTFVVFLSRVIGSALDRGGSRISYFITTLVLQIVFGFLASIVVAWFSRQREFKADSGASGLMGNPKDMIAALRRLENLSAVGESMPRNMAALAITGDIGKLFATHPPLADRIKALQTISGTSTT